MHSTSRFNPPNIFARRLKSLLSMAAAMAFLTGGCQTSRGEFSEIVEGRLEDGDTTLDQGERYDAFEFDGRKGQRLVAECESGDFDPVLHLLDANDRPIAYNDDTRFGTTTASLKERIETTGKYRLVVRAHQPPGEGAYRLRVELRTE